MALLPDNPESYTINTLLNFGESLITNLIALSAYIAVIMFVWGAIQYFMGSLSGEDAKTSKGKTTITWAVIGIVVILLAQIIVRQVLTSMSATNTDVNITAPVTPAPATPATMTPAGR